MEEVTRKRVLRRLESLPEEQLYQVLDYVEFLEAKYARAAARKPDAFQQFAERIEDQMRVRSVAPKALRGTMKVVSTAGKVLDGVRDLGRGLVAGPSAPPPEGPAADAPGAREGSVRANGSAPLADPSPGPAARGAGEG
jgi:hypothetical protein